MICFIAFNKAGKQVTHTLYRFLCRFSSDTEHLVLNELTADIAFEGVYRYQSRLHLVHKTIFPHLRHLPPEDWPESCAGPGFRSGKLEGLDGRKGVVAACANLRFHYRPRKGISR